MSGLCFHKTCKAVVATAALIVASSIESPLHAQGYIGDARRIALGGVGGSDNVASEMVQNERRYRSLTIPLGIFQIFGDLDVFNPDSDGFDPVLASEYAANPIHFVFGRKHTSGFNRFVGDIVNARVNRDLNTYRQFRLEQQLIAEGLGNPSWGKTFTVARTADATHAIYVGAGPYLAFRTNAQLDPRLVQLFGASTNTYFPNTTLTITDTTTDQLALAVTGGYRGRFRLPAAFGGSGSSADGMYVAANYHYLHGFHFDTFAMATRFDTDAAGLLTFRPNTVPIAVERRLSSSGRGLALDGGVAFVVDRWNFGVGLNGIANRITWKELKREQFTLQNILSGGDFVHVDLPPPGGVERLTLPVVFSADVGYTTAGWGAVAEYAHGFQGHSIHGGLEYRAGAVEWRGGGRLSRSRWYPSGGVGFNVTPRFAIDVALFQISTYIERRNQAAFAISLRFTQQPKA
jgi:hypothetical protein